MIKHVWRAVFAASALAASATLILDRSASAQALEPWAIIDSKRGGKAAWLGGWIILLNDQQQQEEAAFGVVCDENKKLAFRMGFLKGSFLKVGFIDKSKPEFFDPSGGRTIAIDVERQEGRVDFYEGFPNDMLNDPPASSLPMTFSVFEKGTQKLDGDLFVPIRFKTAEIEAQFWSAFRSNNLIVFRHRTDAEDGFVAATHLSGSSRAYSAVTGSCGG